MTKKDVLFMKLRDHVRELIETKEGWENFKMLQDAFFTSPKDKKEWNEFKRYMEVYFK